MAFLKSIRKKGSTLLTAITILIFALAYAFFIIPQNEEEFRGERVRHLERIERNIQNKIQSCEKSELKSNLVNVVKRSTDSTKLADTGRLHYYSSKRSLGFTKSNRMIYVKLDTLFKLPKLLFDEYIIALDSGSLPFAIVNDIPIISMDSLLSRCNRGQIIFDFGKGDYTKHIFAHAFKIRPNHTESSFSCYIFASVNHKTYSKAIYDLRTTTIIYFIIAILILLFTSPLLKAVLLGKRESLNVEDVIKSGISFFIIFQILVTTVLMLVLFGIYKSSSTSDRLKEYSNNIQISFNNSLRDYASFSDALKPLDTIPLTNNYLECPNLESIRKVVLNVLYKSQIVPLFTINALKNLFPKTPRIFWLNDKGERIKRILLNDSSLTWEKVNYSDRDYFKRTICADTSCKKHSIFEINGNRFYFEPVFSWLNSELRCVFATPCNKHLLCIGSSPTEFTYKSDDFPEKVYQYCLINQQAEVLLHSNKHLSLNENLVEEFSNSKELRAALASNTEFYLNTSYHGHDYRVRISPVDKFDDNRNVDNLQMPGYYFVTFYKIEVDNAMFTQTINSSIFLYFLIFLFLLSSIIMLSFSRRQKEVPLFSIKKFSWIYPNVTNVDNYAKVFNSNIIYFILLAFFTFLLRSNSSSIILYLLCVFLLTSILTSFILLTENEKKVKGQYIGFLLFYIASVVLLFITFNVPNQGSFIYKAMFPVINLLLCVLFLKTPRKSILQRTRYYLTRISEGIFLTLLPRLDNSFQKTYCTFILSIFISWSVVPGCFITYTAYNYEKGLYIEYLKKAGSPEQHDHKDEQLSFLNSFLKKVRILNTDYAIESMNLYKSSHDYKASFKNLIKQHKKTFYLIVGSILFLVLGTLLLFIALNYFIGKFFFITVFENHKIQQLDHDILFKLGENKIPYVYLIGPPFSGKSRASKKFLERNSALKIEYIDCIELKDITTMTLNDKIKNAEVVILDHFEYDLSNPLITEKKYDLLQGLLNKKDVRVILVSIVQPAEFKNTYLRKCYPDEAEYSKNQALWELLMFNFYKLCYPLQGIRDAIEIETVKKSEHEQTSNNSFVDQFDAEIQAFLEKELDHGFYLKQLIDPLKDYIHPRNPISGKRSGKTRMNISLYGDRETIINKIQSMAYNYYASLWNFLNEEEKIIIVDIAQDGYVNMNNHDSIIALISMGIILEQEGTLAIFNESFARFAIAEFTHPTIEIEKEVEDYQLRTWKNIRLPLSIVILATVLFLCATQKDFFASAIGIITTAGTSLTVIFNLIRSSDPVK